MNTYHPNFLPRPDTETDVVQCRWQALRILHDKVLNVNLPFGRRPVRRGPPLSDKRSLLGNFEVLDNTFDRIEVQFNLREDAN
jgi:hypothetical protein